MKNELKKYSFKITEDQIRKLKKLAHHHEVNASQYLRKLIDEKYLEMLTKLSKK